MPGLKYARGKDGSKTALKGMGEAPAKKKAKKKPAKKKAKK